MRRFVGCGAAVHMHNGCSAVSGHAATAGAAYADYALHHALLRRGRALARSNLHGVLLDIGNGPRSVHACTPRAAVFLAQSTRVHRPALDAQGRAGIACRARELRRAIVHIWHCRHRRSMLPRDVIQKFSSQGHLSSRRPQGVQPSWYGPTPCARGASSPRETLGALLPRQRNCYAGHSPQREAERAAVYVAPAHPRAAPEEDLRLNTQPSGGQFCTGVDRRRGIAQCCIALAGGRLDVQKLSHTIPALNPPLETVPVDTGLTKFSEPAQCTVAGVARCRRGTKQRAALLQRLALAPARVEPAVSAGRPAGQSDHHPGFETLRARRGRPAAQLARNSVCLADVADIACSSSRAAGVGSAPHTTRLHVLQGHRAMRRHLRASCASPRYGRVSLVRL